MKATFPMRTGDVSYQIGLSAPDITGSWSVSMGFFGLNENSWSISGMSGKLYDNSGYWIGSYNAKTYTNIAGVISGESHNIFQDGVLLSNTARQPVNDYNMVSISGTYLGGYLPKVLVGGRSVVNNQSNQTVPFWSKPNDDRLLFVTENATADMGFIESVSGMGFNVTTGLLTGNPDPSLTRGYGLIIFGAATSSGAYNNGGWNSLNTPMMSLNSNLICSGNLDWSHSPPMGWELGGGNSTGAAWVFPNSFETAGQNGALWAEGPIVGWERFYYNIWTAESATDMWYYPYVSGIGATDRSIRFLYNAPSAGKTTVTWYGANSATRVFATDVRPVVASSPGLSPAAGLPQDLSLTFTDVAGATGVTTVLSNTLGGTGAPANDLTGSQWGLDQIWNQNRVIPQRASYNVNNLYRRTTLTSGNFPTDSFNMYTGMPWSAADGLRLVAGDGGDTFVSTQEQSIWPETDYPLYSKFITVWHKGFWTGSVTEGGFATNELMSFAVTPTGNNWATGYDMWNTLTPTGKRLFVNSVAGFFIP